MPFYENVFIARQDIAGPQADALADTFAALIEQGGGKVTKKENWGLRSLAFRMKKNRKGHYLLLNIDAPAAAEHAVRSCAGARPARSRAITRRRSTTRT